jgi:hypothetical protein
MTTRLEMRTTVRRELEDTGVTPFWDDATIDEYIGDSIRRYGARFPAERTVTVTAGTPTISLPVVPAIDSIQIARVIDPNGEIVPRQVSERPLGGERLVPIAQAWRFWGQTLLLTRPAITGDWRIDYLGGRIPPADDVSPLDVIEGDEPIIASLTAGTALRRRAVEVGKRALAREAMDLEHLADSFDAQARHLIASRKRTVKAGWLG